MSKHAHFNRSGVVDLENPKVFIPEGRQVTDLAYTVAPDHVLLVPDDDSVAFRALLGDAPATVSQGYGGFESVPVPGRRARAVWRGPDVLGLQITVMIDGLLGARGATGAAQGRGHSVEAMCARLEHLAGLTKGVQSHEPPELRVYGVAIPHSFHRNPSWRWVISDLEWGDPVLRKRPHGARRRQGAVITLWRAGDPDPLERLPRRSQRPQTRTIHAHKGDTYKRIAKRELGNARLGGRLARFNGHKDAHKELSKGAKVKLPAGDKLRDWKRDLRGHKAKG